MSKPAVALGMFALMISGSGSAAGRPIARPQESATNLKMRPIRAEAAGRLPTVVPIAPEAVRFESSPQTQTKAALEQIQQIVIMAKTANWGSQSAVLAHAAAISEKPIQEIVELARAANWGGQSVILAHAAAVSGRPIEEILKMARTVNWGSQSAILVHAAAVSGRPIEEIVGRARAVKWGPQSAILAAGSVGDTNGFFSIE